MANATKKFAGLAGLALLGSMTVGALAPAHAVDPVAEKGEVTASGDVTFDCLLLPFNSAFQYKSPVKLSTTTNDEGSLDVKAAVNALPGIAPVEIDGGKMTVTLEGTMAGQEMLLKGKSTVKEAANAPVEVPVLTGTAPLAEGGDEISLSRFTFAFEEMMGLVIEASCDTSGDGDLKTVGDVSGSDENSAAAAVGDQADGGSNVLVLAGLIGVPVALLVAALLVWLPRRKRQQV